MARPPSRPTSTTHQPRPPIYQHHGYAALADQALGAFQALGIGLSRQQHVVIPSLDPPHPLRPQSAQSFPRLSGLRKRRRRVWLVGDGRPDAASGYESSSDHDEGDAPASSDDDSEAGADDDTDSRHANTDDTDVDLLNEDDTYLQDLARSARVASQTLSQADPDRPTVPLRRLENDPNAAFFAHLLDPVLRSDLRNREFSEFVPHQHRNTFEVDKSEIKSFFRIRAQKFVDMVSSFFAVISSVCVKWQATHFS